MPRYLATQTRELIIEAPSAAIARAIANDGFAQKLRPEAIKPGMSISNITTTPTTVEKVK